MTGKSKHSQPDRLTDDRAPLADDAFARKLELLEASIRSGSNDALCEADTTKNGEVTAATSTLQLLEEVGRNSAFGTAPSSESNAPGEVELPKHIGRFRIEERIGKGGYGIVLRAFDPELRRQVAVKIPRLQTLLTKEMLDRFLREGEAVAALDHANIVAVFEAGRDGPLPYIASSWIDGESLDQWLARSDGPIDCRIAVQIMMTLADAIGHAHSRGILHRDIKPANILIERESGGSPQSNTDIAPSSLRITDFGLAAFSSQSTSDETSDTSLQVVGTPAYMSPEQATPASQVVGTQSDIHALGVILYELLTRQLPFERGSVDETLSAVRSQEPQSPRSLHRNVPHDLEAICLKCLRKNPAERYDTATALRNDLQRFLDRKPVNARTVPAAQHLWKWAVRHPGVATLAVLLTVCIASIAIGASIVAGQFKQQAIDVQASLTRANAAEQSLRETVHLLSQKLANQSLDQSFQHYDKVIEFGQPTSNTWIRRGEIWWHKGDYDSALADFQKALAVERSNAYAMDYIAWMRIFGPESIRDLDKARDLLIAANRIADSWSIQQTTGAMHYYRGEYEQSLHFMNQACNGRSDGGNALMLFIRAMALQKLSHLEESQRDYSAAVDRVAGQTETPWLELNRVHQEADSLIAPK